MKLLVITQYFFPENFRINDLVASLVKRGHEVTVLTGQPNYPNGQFFDGYGFRGPQRELLFGAQIVRVPLLPRGDGSAIRLFFNYLSFVVTSVFGVLFRLRQRHDAVFVFGASPITVGIPAIVAAWRFRAPVLLWVLDLWPESLSATGAIQNKIALSSVGMLVKWIYRSSDRVLVSSKGFVPTVIKYGARPHDVRYFPNWVEESPIRSTSELPTLPDGFLIIFAGNLGMAQDVPAILEAAKLTRDISNVHWIFVGDGSMAHWALEETLRADLRCCVHFVGRWPLETMPALFARAGALLVSLKPEPIFAKTVPGKVQSYMAAAKPLLAMLDGEGAHLVAESGAGLACAGGDAQGLAANVRMLLALSETQRETMGRAGKAYAAEHFDRDTLIGGLVDWMDEIVKETQCKKMK